MDGWRVSYRRGLRALSRHRDAQAIRDLTRAADACPAEAFRSLSAILYYLGLALERSGQGCLAVKSWISARKLVKRGPVASACDRWVNDYGMRRRATCDDDDFHAFVSIHERRYLAKRGSGRFGSRAERDAVLDFIADAWKGLRASGLAAGLGTSEKLKLFRRVRVDLPYLSAQDAFSENAEPLRVDFRGGLRGARSVPSDAACPCGSGLPSRVCCGRLPSRPELENGAF